MPTKQQELQSLLLRLSVLVATSLSTISQPIPPNVLEESDGGKDAIAGPSREKSNDALRAQIVGDTKKLFQSVQKACTYLTLALRPEGATAGAATEATKRAESISPTSGLRDTSIEAATAQLTTIMNDAVPKLVFLSRKASSDATLHHYAVLTKEEIAEQEAERAAIKAKGGHIIQQAHAREGKKLVKVVNGGLGRIWAKGLGEAIFELLQALGNLSQTYMDEKTRAVMLKAAQARDLADGVASSSSMQQRASDMPTSIEDARQRALQATAIVWEVCEATLKENGAGCKLDPNNRQAVQRAWRKRTEILQDALRELTEGIEGEVVGEDDLPQEEKDADDPFAGLGSLTLPKEEKEQGRRFLSLLKAGCRLHAKVGESFLAGTTASDTDVDLDDLDAAGDALEEAVSDVTSAVLYGDDMPGIESTSSHEHGSASDEDEDDNEVEEALASFLRAVERLRQAATTNNRENGAKQRPFQDQIDAVQKAVENLNVKN